MHLLSERSHPCDTFTHICLHVHMYKLIYICLYTYLNVYIHIAYIQTPTYIQTHACLPTFIHAYLHVHLQTYNISVFLDFQICIFLEFPMFQKYDNLEILKILKPILMPYDNYVSVGQKVNTPSSYLKHSSVY